MPPPSDYNVEAVLAMSFRDMLRPGIQCCGRQVGSTIETAKSRINAPLIRSKLYFAIVVAAAASALASQPQTSVAASGSGPNIVMILADDLGIGDLGVNGQNARAANGLPAIATPNIDALAAQGVSFTRMYSGAPVCSPSRASLLTGFEMNHVIKQFTDQHAEGLRAGELDKTWGQMLQSAGYETAMFGKWHLGGVDSPTSALGVHTPHAIPTQKGFEVAYGSMNGGYRTQYLWENDGLGGLKLSPVPYEPTWTGPGAKFKYSQEVTSEHAVQFVRDHANAAAPFAAYVAFEAAHEPFDRTPMDPEYADKPWPEVQKQYASMVKGLDRNVGAILAAIDDPNGDGDMSDSVASNTLVIFASDNGALWTPHANGFVTEFFDSNGPFRGQKTNTLEGGIRTPFFVRWNGVTTPGSVNDSHVGSFADIYPTFAELASQETPIGLDGVSMLSSITGQGTERRQDAIVWSSPDNFTGLNQASWAIQMGDWKLIRRMSNLAYELYHISEDPYETTNLAASRADIRVALEAVVTLEGVTEESFYLDGNQAQNGRNVFFTQYKSWSPPEGSNSFGAAANWAGGTQFNRTTDPESKYWNTGPSLNWLATVSNTLDGYRNAWVGADARVLGLEIAGPAGTMQVNVNPGVKLGAYNGVRVRDGGILRLIDSTVTTAKEIEILEGGALTGAGLITGYQEVIAGVAEFQNKGLLDPEVVNSGLIDPFNGSLAGTLAINGDLTQRESGELRIDLFGAGGAAGVDFDKLTISGNATLAGTLAINLVGAFLPTPGQLFPVLSAGSLNLEGLQLTGPASNLFSLSVMGGTDLVLIAGPVGSADFDGNGIVNGDDLAIWKERYGATTGGLGDANGDGYVDGDDFLNWQRHFGSPATTGAVATIPEPSTLAMGLVVGVLFLSSRVGKGGRRA